MKLGNELRKESKESLHYRIELDTDLVEETYQWNRMEKQSFWCLTISDRKIQ